MGLIVKYWITTDSHFGHQKVLDVRKEGFEDRILEDIGRVVGIHDVLIHLGDVAFGRDHQWNLRLNNTCQGKTWLVKGNHDKKSDAWYLDRGWDCVCSTFSMDRHDKEIVFSHIPLEDCSGCDINIHGHIHNFGHRTEEYKLIKNEKHLLIEVDSGVNVFSLDSLIQKRIREIEG